MVRKYQTTVGSFGSWAKERAGERARSSEGRQVEAIDHRASGGKHPEAQRRQRGEARQCCGIQMEQCDCVQALLHGMQTTRILMLFIRLYGHSAPLSRLLAWFEIWYTLDSLHLGHGPESVGNSITTFRRNVVVSSSLVETSGYDHPVTQGHLPEERNPRLHRCAHLRTCMLLILRAICYSLTTMFPIYYISYFIRV